MRQNVRTEGFEATGFKNLDEQDEVMGMQVVEYKGEKFTLKQMDPFALWTIIPAKGKLPEKLEGQFTSPMLAEREIQLYINNRDKAKLEVATQAD